MIHARVRKFKKSEEGFAVLEAVSFLMAFIIFTLYIIDLFSAIHSGIVGSMAARTYLFETLEHRTNLSWLRQSDTPSLAQADGGRRSRFYAKEHERFHAVTDESSEDSNSDGLIRSPGRNLTQVNPDDQIQDVRNSGLDSSKNKTSSIKIKSGYGICLDAQCPQEPQ